MSQEKWQNKAHIHIGQYVKNGIFENSDLKQVSKQKLFQKIGYLL